MHANMARMLAKKYDASLVRKFFSNDANHALYLNALKITYVYVHNFKMNGLECGK